MDTSSSADFRSRRFELPKEAFAIAPEIEPEPTDVVTRRLGIPSSSDRMTSHGAPAIAGALSRSGLVTGRGNRWTRERVTSLRSYHDIPVYSTDRRRAEGRLTLTEAADHLQMSGATPRLAIERGEIEAEHPLSNGPWVISRSALETAAALQFAERSRRQRQNPRLQASGQGNIDFSAT